MGISWSEMEVLADPRGKPYVRLYGRAAARALAQLRVTGITAPVQHQASLDGRTLAALETCPWAQSGAINCNPLVVILRPQTLLPSGI